MWTGPGTPVAALADANPGLVAMYRFDAWTQTWAVFINGAHAVASTLRTISTEDVLFVRADRQAQLLPPQSATRFTTSLEATFEALRSVSPLRACAAWLSAKSRVQPGWLVVLTGNG